MAMAATAVLESLAAPRARQAPLGMSPRAAVLASAAVAVASPFDRRLPHFVGLRALPVAPRASVVLPQGSRRRAASVVCEAQDTALFLPDVDKSTWQSLVLDSDTPVLVDFWAPWCGPCRMIEPTILNLAEVYAGKLKCYKLNTDENADIASQYSIRSIPTVMIFKDGEKKETVIGAVPEGTLISSIEKFVER